MRRHDLADGLVEREIPWREGAAQTPIGSRTTIWRTAGLRGWNHAAIDPNAFLGMPIRRVRRSIIHFAHGFGQRACPGPA